MSERMMTESFAPVCSPCSRGKWSTGRSRMRASGRRSFAISSGDMVAASPLSSIPSRAAPVDQLVGAVHVPAAHPEQEAACGCPEKRVDLAERGVGAAGPVADDRVGALSVRLFQERRAAALP